MLITMFSSRGSIGSSSVTDTGDLAVILSPKNTQRYKNVLHFVPRSVRIQAPRGMVLIGILRMVSATALKTMLDIKNMQVIFTSKFSRHEHLNNMAVLY